MNNDEWNKVFDIFEGLTHRCGGMNGDLTDKTINDFIGNGQACVVIISDDGPARPEKGIYNTGTQFLWDGEGHWSSTELMTDMASDQLSYLASHRNLVKSGGIDKFLVMQWILTLGVLDSAIPTVSIEAIATRFPFDALFWRAWNAFTPRSYPNVVLLDFVGTLREGERGLDNSSGELIAFAMAVNLAIASKNCNIGGGTIY